MRQPELLLETVRRQIGSALRDRVAGPDAVERAERIWGTSGPRWFSPDDPIWRIHQDAAMFIGGIRALLLQSLHPLAMAGVAGHSGYRGDPWGRLQRTSDFIATTTFGTVPDAERAIARVRGVHRRVRGRTADGTGYSATDPHLLEWVHAAEVDSFLHTHQRFGAEPLTVIEADTYIAQSGTVAARLGANLVPHTTSELRQQIDAFRPELRATAECRDAARFLLLQPPLPLISRPGYGLLAAGAVATLPGWARSMLRLPPRFGPLDASAVALATLGTRVVRWSMASTQQRAS